MFYFSFFKQFLHFCSNFLQFPSHGFASKKATDFFIFEIPTNFSWLFPYLNLLIYTFYPETTSAPPSVNVLTPELVKFTSPLTVNLASGAVVPMPTLPEVGANKILL